MNTQYEQWLDDEARTQLNIKSYRAHEAWIILCNGKMIPMQPTPSERGAHARAKAHFFHRMQNGKDQRWQDVFPGMDRKLIKKEFKAWYDQHCKAVNLIV